MAEQSNLSRKDRIVGCLIAGALGDAIGSYFEGREVQPDFVIPDQLRITDDTQLTLATCEAILDKEIVEPDSIAQSFLRWHRQARIRGIGAATLKALRDLDAGCHWALAGATGEQSAGNGAAMRIAPVAIVLDPDDDVARTTLRDVCRITHRNDEAYVGALAIARTVRHVMHGQAVDDAYLAELINLLPDSRVRDRLLVTSQDLTTARDYCRHFASGGYVVDSVPLSLLLAKESADFVTTMRQIVTCGGDTDTIGSMFGQFYGAGYGVNRLPSELLARIEGLEYVKEVASAFASFATSFAT